MGRCGFDKCGSGLGSMADCSEHGNEHSGSTEGGEFLGHLSDC